MTALGDRIKALRAECRLRQRQLAEKAGLTPSMGARIESGQLTCPSRRSSRPRRAGGCA